MAMQKHFLKVLLLSLLASLLAALGDPIYAIKFLPQAFQAANINNAGKIVGTYGDAAATWSETGIIDIGAIAPGSFGFAINNRGDIGGSWQGNAFVYSSGVPRNNGQLGIWPNSQATALNDAGQAAGNGRFEAGERQDGFVFSGGVFGIIQRFGGDWRYAGAINSAGQGLISEGYDINDAGQVVVSRRLRAGGRRGQTQGQTPN